MLMDKIYSHWACHFRYELLSFHSPEWDLLTSRRFPPSSKNTRIQSLYIIPTHERNEQTENRNNVRKIKETLFAKGAKCHCARKTQLLHNGN